MRYRTHVAGDSGLAGWWQPQLGPRLWPGAAAAHRAGGRAPGGHNERTRRNCRHPRGVALGRVAGRNPCRHHPRPRQGRSGQVPAQQGTADLPDGRCQRRSRPWSGGATPARPRPQPCRAGGAGGVPPLRRRLRAPLSAGVHRPGSRNQPGSPAGTTCALCRPSPRRRRYGGRVARRRQHRPADRQRPGRGGLGPAVAWPCLCRHRAGLCRLRLCRRARALRLPVSGQLRRAGVDPGQLLQPTAQRPAIPGHDRRGWLEQHQRRGNPIHTNPAGALARPPGAAG